MIRAVKKEPPPPKLHIVWVWVRRAALGVGLIVWIMAGMKAVEARDGDYNSMRNSCSQHTSGSVKTWKCN